MSTTPSYPENNLIKAEDLVRVREADFAFRFGESVKKLVEALGITRKIAKQAGTVLKAYKAVGNLEDGIVAEGDLIPLSQYETEAINFGEITIKKWRKATSAEAIISGGYDQAVGMTTDRMLKDVQKGIRADFFAFLENGTTITGGTDLQATIAQAWGQLAVKFEDDEIESVYFVNPLDIADYLASAEISTQNAFGMKYVEDFLGMGTVIINNSVPKGKIYATAKENLVLYYLPVNGADLGEAFSFTSDELGLIGIHEVPDYDNMTAKDTVVNGMTLFAERLDGIVISNIDSTPTLGSLTVASIAGTAVGDTAISITEAKQAATDTYKYKVATAETPVTYGQNCKTWTTWDGTSDITAATGKVITVVEVDGDYRAQAAGSATVTAKA